MQRDPTAPPVLDGYTAVRVLGLGGFSDVFLYEQELPRRQVAVKVLSGQLTDAVRSAFVREANLMAALSTHPYIVTIHQAGIAGDGRPYLVMEYCSRPSLAERYKRQPLSVADTLRTGVRIAGAVATLHGAGILHRDIKPANVLTNDYGWPALTDFGIATAFELGAFEDADADADEEPFALAPRAAAADPDAAAFGDTGSGALGLSVPWSPPEMFADMPDPDVRSDVFSLAATLYTVLAGRTPFEVPDGPNGHLDLIARIERGAVIPATRPDLPVSLQAALVRGMAPRREDRWPTALEFARALQRIELELGWAPTGIEVPGVEGRPDRIAAEEGGDADETPMRAMPAVVAQPGAVPPGDPGTTAPPVPGAAVRSAPGGPAPAPAPLPGANPSAALGLGTATRASRRGTVVAVVIGGLAVLAVTTIVLALLFVGTGGPESDRPSPERTGGSTISSGLPAPTNGAATVSSDGTIVTFTWADSSPQDGDVFSWARSETPDDLTSTPDARAVVSGVVPGSRVCIDVVLGRAGLTSAATRICAAG